MCNLPFSFGNLFYRFMLKGTLTMPKPKGILPIPWKELYQTKNHLGKSLLPVKGHLGLRPHPLSLYRGLTPIESKQEGAILGPWKICLDTALGRERRNILLYGTNQDNTESGLMFRSPLTCKSSLQRCYDMTYLWSKTTWAFAGFKRAPKAFKVRIVVYLTKKFNLKHYFAGKKYSKLFKKHNHECAPGF